MNTRRSRRQPLEPYQPEIETFARQRNGLRRRLQFELNPEIEDGQETSEFSSEGEEMENRGRDTVNEDGTSNATVLIDQNGRPLQDNDPNALDMAQRTDGRVLVENPRDGGNPDDRQNPVNGGRNGRDRQPEFGLAGYGNGQDGRQNNQNGPIQQDEQRRGGQFQNNIQPPPFQQQQPLQNQMDPNMMLLFQNFLVQHQQNNQLHIPQINQNAQFQQQQMPQFQQQQNDPPQNPGFVSARDYVVTSYQGTGHNPIRIPAIHANNMEPKQNVINMISENAVFYGKRDEDPNEFLDNYLQVISTLKYNGVSEEALKLMMFQFALRGAAKTWFNTLPHASLSTWAEVVDVFLKKYFPPAKIEDLKREIHNFNGRQGESMKETVERFRALLKKCPPHNFSTVEQVIIIYRALERSDRNHLDATSGGGIMKIDPELAMRHINEAVDGDDEWVSNFGRENPKEQQQTVKALEEQLERETAAHNELLALQTENKKLKEAQQKLNEVQQTCQLCGGNHTAQVCMGLRKPSIPQQLTQQPPQQPVASIEDLYAAFSRMGQGGPQNVSQQNMARNQQLSQQQNSGGQWNQNHRQQVNNQNWQQSSYYNQDQDSMMGAGMEEELQQNDVSYIGNNAGGNWNQGQNNQGSWNNNTQQGPNWGHGNQGNQNGQGNWDRENNQNNQWSRQNSNNQGQSNRGWNQNREQGSFQNSQGNWRDGQSNQSWGQNRQGHWNNNQQSGNQSSDIYQHPNAHRSNNSSNQQGGNSGNQKKQSDDNCEQLNKFMIEQKAAVRNLEIQMGQLTDRVQSPLNSGLPSNTEKNPRQVNAVFTRSGKHFGAEKDSDEDDDEEISQAETELERLNRELACVKRDLAIAKKERAMELDKEQEAQTKRDEAPESEKGKVIVSEEDLEKAKLNDEIARLREENADYKLKWEEAKTSKKDSVVLDREEATPAPPRQKGMKGRIPPPPPGFDVNTLPYPPKASKKSTLTESQIKFLEMLRKVEINIPLLEAVASVPAYYQCLKGALSSREKLNEVVKLREECSAVYDSKVPPKMRDRGGFTIPITIGNTVIENVLCDLGASVSLMPRGLYEKLGMGELKPTRMTLQMADKSIRIPLGVAEDVLVQVGRFMFPVDFVILDMDMDSSTSVLLGRPFLNTSDARICVKDGDISFCVDGQRETINVYKGKGRKAESDACLYAQSVFSCFVVHTDLQDNENAWKEDAGRLRNVGDRGKSEAEKNKSGTHACTKFKKKPARKLEKKESMQWQEKAVPVDRGKPVNNPTIFMRAPGTSMRIGNMMSADLG